MSYSKATSVKTYTIDLDAPAADRWKHVVSDYKDGIHKILQYCDQILGSLSYPASWLSWSFANYVFYIDELNGIAEETNIDVSNLILMQLCYEVCACCTSVIFDTPKAALHFRTMDWSMPELKEITFNARFIKGGETLYTATTWAGYVGVMTACRKDIGSVSLNYRRANDGIMSNLSSMIAGSWPAGFLIRHSIETANDYDQLKSYLSKSKLISPCYLTICGPTPKTGRILVRNREGLDISYKMSDLHYLVQTNIDHDKIEESDNILMSKERLAKTYELLGANAENINNLGDLFRVLFVYPILNSETIYVTIMSPESGVFDSYV